jgi:hypothetical protein
MAQLTFYGGIGGIGSNKILPEEKQLLLLLDYGFPYGKHEQYYAEYLKPRRGTWLLDALEMGLLLPWPHLTGNRSMAMI